MTVSSNCASVVDEQTTLERARDGAFRMPLTADALQMWVHPTDGTLVFFADFSEQSDGWGPARADESVIRVMYVPPGAAPWTVDAPDEPRGPNDVPVELGERRVRFEPVLTLPDPDPDDLSDEDWQAYERLTDQLYEITPGLGADAHLMLGHPTVVQADPPSQARSTCCTSTGTRNSARCTKDRGSACAGHVGGPLRLLGGSG